MHLLKNFLETELGINDPIVFQKFIQYNELIMEWNEKINVVSRKILSIEDIIINSIFFLKKYKLNPDTSMLDVGTGGGFPGIPLKIIYPDLRITLCDSIKKKIFVVNEIIHKMNLRNAEAICERVEMMWKIKKYKNKFDYITAKSVAKTDKLYLWTKELIKPNGSFIFIKGGEMENEISSLEKNKNVIIKSINFDFDVKYKIEDKKIIIIKQENG